jgi:hypothetical protein
MVTVKDTDEGQAAKQAPAADESGIPRRERSDAAVMAEWRKLWHDEDTDPVEASNIAHEVRRRGLEPAR